MKASFASQWRAQLSANVLAFETSAITYEEFDRRQRMTWNVISADRRLHSRVLREMRASWGGR